MGPKPELRPARPQIENRLGHVGIAPLVRADAVGVAEAEHHRELLGVGQVLGADRRCHGRKSIPLDNHRALGASGRPPCRMPGNVTCINDVLRSPYDRSEPDPT